MSYRNSDRYEVAYYTLECEGSCGTLDEIESESLRDLRPDQMGLVNYTVKDGDPVCTGCGDGEISVAERWPSEDERDACHCRGDHCYC